MPGFLAARFRLPLKIDLHCHSTESDGTLSPAALMRAAADDGVHVVALTDHDTLSGIGRARIAARECGIELVPGVEVSCRHGSESVHLLGLFVDPEDRVLRRLFARAARLRRRRIRETCERLTECGVPLHFAEVTSRSSGKSLGRPHVADALVAKGAVRDRQEAFDRYLGDGKPGHVEYGAKITVTQAAKLIHDAGGITSVAHPKFLRDQAGVSRMLRRTGVKAIEAYHPEHSAAERARYLELADSLGLLVTGGSDFHLRLANGRGGLGSALPERRYRELVSAASGGGSATSTASSSIRTG